MHISFAHLKNQIPGQNYLYILCHNLQYSYFNEATQKRQSVTKEKNWYMTIKKAQRRDRVEYKTRRLQQVLFLRVLRTFSNIIPRSCNRSSKERINMEEINFKLSTSRKPAYKLSVWQRRKVLLEIRRNLCPHNRSNSDRNIRECNNSTRDILIPVVARPSEYFDNNDINDINDTDNESVLSSSSFCGSNGNEDVSLFFEDYDLSFQEQLASCFVNNNLTHVQSNNILTLLRKHSCFSSLPRDVRTLLGTPRTRVIVSNVEPGEYVHFDLAESLVQSISNISSANITNTLKLDISTDGCSLDRSGNVHIWPIQCRITNIRGIKPIVVGIYKGAQKPDNAHKFFEQLVTDIRTIISSGGIDFNGKKISVWLRCFIADAPARAFILNHRSHMSAQPCSKCKVEGVRCEGRYVFDSVDNCLRTDENYVMCIDEDHHKGTSPLEMLPLGMVSRVPFEYMHLVCLGVMKKLLCSWVHGKYSRNSKLTGRSISIVSARLNHLRDYCPSEFARRPRPLDTCSKFKATEYRQFLLYTGPVVMYDILDEQLYKHFLFLHTAIRILVFNSPSELLLNFAELALKKFVIRSKNLYGLTFNSYNVHGLLHLVSDVKQLGTLDSFSAFPYESNMSIFKKYLRKPALPLAQFAKRLAENVRHGKNNNRDIECSVHVSMPYNNNNINALHRHYRKIQFNRMSLSLHMRDNCCILHNGLICIVVDIVVDNNSYRLAVKRFVHVEDFYDVGISSSVLGIYKCSKLDSDTFFINLEEVQTKCYKMILHDSSSMDNISSDEEDHSENDQYVIASIIHTE